MVKVRVRGEGKPYVNEGPHKDRNRTICICVQHLLYKIRERQTEREEKRDCMSPDGDCGGGESV